MASCGKLLRHIKVIPFQVFRARLIKQRRERRIWFCLKIGFDKFDCLSGFIMVEHPPILFHGQSLVVHKKKSFAVYGYFPLIATQPTGFKHALTCLNHPSKVEDVILPKIMSRTETCGSKTSAAVAQASAKGTWYKSVPVRRRTPPVPRPHPNERRSGSSAWGSWDTWPGQWGPIR